jgi:hypothetical protein
MRNESLPPPEYFGPDNGESNVATNNIEEPEPESDKPQANDLPFQDLPIGDPQTQKILAVSENESVLSEDLDDEPFIVEDLLEYRYQILKQIQQRTATRRVHGQVGKFR